MPADTTISVTLEATQLIALIKVIRNGRRQRGHYLEDVLLSTLPLGTAKAITELALCRLMGDVIARYPDTLTLIRSMGGTSVDAFMLRYGVRLPARQPND